MKNAWTNLGEWPSACCRSITIEFSTRAWSDVLPWTQTQQVVTTTQKRFDSRKRWPPFASASCWPLHETLFLPPILVRACPEFPHRIAVDIFLIYFLAGLAPIAASSPQDAFCNQLQFCSTFLINPLLLPWKIIRQRQQAPDRFTWTFHSNFLRRLCTGDFGEVPAFLLCNGYAFTTRLCNHARKSKSKQMARLLWSKQTIDLVPPMQKP